MPRSFTAIPSAVFPVPLGGNAVTLGKGTLVSRVFGFVRDALIAALLGGGWLADAFLVAFRVPNFVRRLLAEGALAYTLVPACRELQRADAARLWVYVRTMTLVLAGIFGVAAALGMAFAGQAVVVLAPGFLQNPEYLAMAALFLTLCLPYLPLAAASAVASAALMAEGRFKAPAYAPAVLNVVIIAFALAAFLFYEPGDRRVPYVLCAGVVAAGAAQWLFQLPALFRAGFSFMGAVSPSDRAVTRSLRALPGTAFGAAGNQANILLATFLASFLAEGNVSALYFAERLIEFPLGVIGASLGLAALSDLSGLAPENGGEASTFTESLGRAVRFAFFFGLPASVGIACLAPSLVSLIFGYGGFGPDAVARTGAALLAYAAGLPALAVIRPLLAGLGAVGDASAPMRGSLLGFGTTLVLGAVSLLVGAAWGPALAVSVAAWGNAAYLAYALFHKGFSPLPSRGWMVQTLAACLVMGACVLMAGGLFATATARVLLCVPFGVLVYFASASALGLGEALFSLRIAVSLVKKSG